jgi:hypothetical protein
MKKVIKELNKLSPGFLPKEVFEAVARLVVTPTLVVFPYMKTEDGIKVCLKRRGKDVSGDAGLIHPTGTIILATDNSLEDTYKRLLKEELSDVNVVGEPKLCEVVFTELKRGKEISLLHYVEIDSATPEDLYNPENLPSDVVGTDIPRIEATYKQFKEDTK